MIDLPTQKEMNSPHHRRAVWALIAAGLLLGALLAAYYLKPPVIEDLPSQSDMAQKRALLNEAPATLDLTASEIKTRQTLLNKDATSLKLTPEQIKAQQDLLNQ